MFRTTIKFFVGIVVVFSLAQVTHAANLSFSANTQYAVGDTVTVPVLLSTDGSESVNAVSVKIIFPADLLEITSVSKNGSIVNFWPSEPEYSASAGTAQFDGVILNPGWSGKGGTVVTLTFRARAVGNTKISFDPNTKVLANDGRGTNILKGTQSQTVAIVSGTIAPVGGPKITSSTYPDQTRWYNTKKGYFSWPVPSGVTSVRLLYDHNPNSTPTEEYTPVISEKKVAVADDGVYFFHVQLKDVDGWGPVGHYKFQIDTVPPSPSDIKLAHPEQTTDPRPILLFNTNDSLSGIDHYVVDVDNTGFLTFKSESTKSNPYTPAWLGPGNKTITVAAYDRAGNVATSTKTLAIESIDTPQITDYPSILEQGDILKIRGQTYPQATITVRLKDDRGVVTTDTAVGNGFGVFTLVWTKILPPGVYTFTVEAVDTRGGLSNQSETYSFEVRGGGFFDSINSSMFLWIIILFVLIGTAVFTSFHVYVWGKVRWLKTKLLLAASNNEGKEFVHMNDFINCKIMLEKAAEKRNLTDEEMIILKEIRKRINASKHKID